MPLARKLAHFVALSSDEIAVLQDLQNARRNVRRHRDIVSEGRKYEVLYVLLEGFAIRCRVLRNGGRQVLNVALPGDFIGFPGCFFECALYSVSALTNTVLSAISHVRLVSLFETCPRLATKIFWSFACEAAMYTEHLIDLGRRSALERVAHFMLELLTRLKIIGLADERSFRMPLTQELIADALGLSVPHVNRTIRQLRDDELVSIEGSIVTIKDVEALSALADFDKSYLGQFRLPGLVLEN